MIIAASYLYILPRAFPAICFIPSLEVGRAFSLPGSISKWFKYIFKNLQYYNRWKCGINEHIVKILIQIMRLFLSFKQKNASMSWKDELEKEEGGHVQSERVGFTVTKQQSNKSAFALRNVNPCSAILRSSQRLENNQTDIKKTKLEIVFFFCTKIHREIVVVVVKWEQASASGG